MTVNEANGRIAGFPMEHCIRSLRMGARTLRINALREFCRELNSLLSLCVSGRP
jgi:hypothetical protein